ncbi:NAD(+)/NADH kinase [Candidatus Woesearchaeota archaeon]|nr:NAD(+)/NADH kinase [Candidatus Woesearchaeota archaeon]
MKVRKVLVAYYVHNYKSLWVVESTLKRHGISYVAVKRGYLRKSHFKNKDLVITVGGDGTFLRTAHLAGGIPMLCVSSDTHLNEGFFARASKDDFSRKFSMLLKGKYIVRELQTLQATINGKIKLPPAINEIFVGSKRPHHTSRYIIRLGKNKEYQKSSGVIVATPAGSTAWSRSAGGEKLPLYSKNYYYVVREPYFGRLTKPKLTKGILKPSQALFIKSDIYDGIAVVDSQPKEYKLLEGDVIEIKKSKNPIKTICF